MAKVQNSKAAKPATKQATKQAAKPAGKGKPEPVAEVNHGNRGTPTAAPVAVAKPKEAAAVAKKFGCEVTTAGEAGVATRATLGGYSITAVLRQLAYTEARFTPKLAAVLVGKLGVPLRPACLSAQVGSGHNGRRHGLPREQFRYGPPAQLPKEQVKALLALCGL